MARAREVEFAEYDAVAPLHQSVGWSRPSEASWRRLWRDNPALFADKPAARGWVLEDGPRIVGYLSNLTQLYHFGGRKLQAATASEMVVLPESRGESMKLVMAFAQQPNVDLLLNTTAAVSTSKIFEFFKFQRIPQADYDLSYYWVVGARKFLNSGLQKKGWSKLVSRAAAPVLAPLLRAEMLLRRRGPRGSCPYALSVRGIEEVGKDFDELFERKLAEAPKLLGDRTAPTLRWHYGPPGKKIPGRLICAHDGPRLVGFVGVVRRDSAHIELPRAYVADIFVEKDDPATIAALLSVAAKQARADGAAMLEAVGFPEHIRALLRTFAPRELRNESWPYLYRARDPELHRALADAAAWQACLFDGDGSI